MDNGRVCVCVFKMSIAVTQTTISAAATAAAVDACATGFEKTRSLQCNNTANAWI